jgi:hypothetical protein
VRSLSKTHIDEENAGYLRQWGKWYWKENVII